MVTASGTFTFTDGILNGSWAAEGEVAIGVNATGGTATLSFTGTANQTYTDSGGNEPDGDITINKTSGTVTLASNADWNATSQDVTITDGTLSLAGYTIATNVLTLTDTLQLQGAETITTTTFTRNAGHTITFTGDGDAAADTYVITDKWTDYENLTLNSTDGATDTFQTNANITVAGNFTKTAGTFDPTTNSNTVTMDATSGTADITSNGSAFYNLTLNDGGGSATFELEDALDVDSNLTIAAGTLDTKSGEDNGITLGGNFVNSDTFTARAHTFTFDKSSGTQTYEGGNNFYNVTHSGAGTLQATIGTYNITGAFTNSAGTYDTNGFAHTYTGLATISGGTFSGSGTQTFNGGLTVSGGTYSASGTADINGTLTLSSGTFTAPGTVTLSGSFTMSGGTFTPGSGTVTLGATSGSPALTSGGASFNHLTLNDAGNNITFTLEDALDVNGNLTITGGTLDTKSGENNAITLAGNWSNSDTFTPRSGTVTFDGSGAQTLTGETFYNLTINNSAASPGDDTDVDSSAAVAVTNTITVTDGQFQPTTASDLAAVSIGTNGILKPDASASLTVSGNWTNNGTFTHNSGTVTFDGTSQTLAGSTTFYNFSKTEASDNATDETLTFTAGTTQTIANTWTLDGRDADDRINLVSSSPGTVWTVNPQGTRTLDFLDVTDSTNSNDTPITCTSDSCVNGGNTTNWQFTSVSASFSSSSQSASETAGAATITVNLSAATEVDVTVPYTISGTATENTDYTIPDSPLTITASNTSDTITVTLTNDGDVEDDKTIILTLGTPTNASQGSTTTHTLTLTSDDVTPGPPPSSGAKTSDPISALENIPSLIAAALPTTTDEAGQTITTVPLNQAMVFTTKPVDSDRVKGITLHVAGQVFTFKPTKADPNNPTWATTVSLTEPGMYPYTLRVDYGTTQRVSKGVLFVPAGPSPPAPSAVALPAPPPRSPRPSLTDQLVFDEPPQVTPLPADTQPPPGPPGQGAAALAPLTAPTLSALDRLGLTITTTLTGVVDVARQGVQVAGVLTRATVQATGELLAGLVEAVTDSGTRLSDALSRSRLALRAALNPSPTPDPRIPEHLKDHRYEEVQVRLATAEGQPMAGAELTLLSEPKHAVTDEHGEAAFHDVPVGEHTLKIAFGTFKGTQELFLNHDVPKLLVAVTPSFEEALLPTWAWVGMMLGTLLAGAVGAWYMAKRKFTSLRSHLR